MTSWALVAGLAASSDVEVWVKHLIELVKYLHLDHIHRGAITVASNHARNVVRHHVHLSHVD